MTELLDIGPGRVQLLWKSGSHDGMARAVGLLDARLPVYLDACELGFERWTPPWQALEECMEKLLDEDDFENIWDRLERKYASVMRETRDRVFHVHAIPSDEFDRMLGEHRLWQLHAGLGSDYWYDEAGTPTLEVAPSYWPTSPAYLAAHYYKQVDWRARREHLAQLPIVGATSRSSLHTPSSLRSPRPSDPRTDELRVYQATWREGDLVRMDW